MHEPTTEPDWEAIETAVSGPSVDDPRSSEKEAFMRGVMLFAQLTVLLPRRMVSVRPLDQARARIMVMSQILKVPGHEPVLSKTHIAELCGVSLRSVTRAVAEIKRHIPVAKGGTKTHRKRKRARSKSKKMA